MQLLQDLKLRSICLLLCKKSIHEENLAQPLQTNNKQNKLAVIFLTGYNGITNVTNKNKKFYFSVSINDDYFSQTTIPPGAYELESLDGEIKRIIFKDGYFTKENYPCIIKANFSTLGSIKEIKPNFFDTQVNFVLDDSIRDLLRLYSVVI